MLDGFELTVGLIILLGAMLINIPVPFAFGAAGIYYFWQIDIPLSTLPQRAVATADSFTLMAIPMFIFVGILMTTGPMAMRLLNFAKALVGHMMGGLAQVNVAASMLFAGMSGSSSADAAGLGTAEIRLMTQAGYTARFSAAVTAASSCVGPLIPPSIPLIIYGAISQVSVGRLFLAGAIPGVLLGLVFMVVVRIMAKDHVEKPSQFKLSALKRATLDAIPELLMPVILMGGLLSGIVTPTEAAGVAVVYGMILIAFRREVTRQEMIQVIRDTVLYSGIFMFIVMMASSFGWILIREQFGAMVFGALLGADYPSWAIILIIVVGLLVIGCFMETISALALAVPVLVPIAPAIGLDPVHLGIIVVFALQVGLITPPVGMSMYIVSAIAGITIYDFVRTVMPFLIAMLFLLIVIAYVPQLSLALPNWIFG